MSNRVNVRKIIKSPNKTGHIWVYWARLLDYLLILLSRKDDFDSFPFKLKTRIFHFNRGVFCLFSLHGHFQWNFSGTFASYTIHMGVSPFWQKSNPPALFQIPMDGIWQMPAMTVKPERRLNFLKIALDNTDADVYNNLTEQSSALVYAGEHSSKQRTEWGDPKWVLIRSMYWRWRVILISE